MRTSSLSNRQNSTGSANSAVSLSSVTAAANESNPNGSIIEDTNSLSTLNEDDTRHEGRMATIQYCCGSLRLQ